MSEDQYIIVNGRRVKIKPGDTSAVIGVKIDSSNSGYDEDDYIITPCKTKDCLTCKWEPEWEKCCMMVNDVIKGPITFEGPCKRVPMHFQEGYLLKKENNDIYYLQHDRCDYKIDDCTLWEAKS